LSQTLSNDSAAIIPRAGHTLSRSNVSQNALKVLYRLHNAGYDAFLVGGSVRDLLLGREPKDFDVATNATPEEILTLFRNSRLIGRRFRIAHIQYHKEIIEVATFRAEVEELYEKNSQTEHGMILHDNVYGSIKEDARRRDFSVNSFYYNIADFSVHDYNQGLKDLEDGVLRMIGDDPHLRYREDPVRILRAVRFAAKLGFRIHPESEQPIFDLGYLLTNISAARLFNEVMKLFYKGMALDTFKLLRHYHLFTYLFAQTEQCLSNEADYENTNRLISLALANTDSRLEAGKSINPAFLIATFLWFPMLKQRRLLEENGVSSTSALLQATDKVIRDQLKQLAIPRRFTGTIQDIWVFQDRLQHSYGAKALRMLSHPRFRAAYDFLLLRAQAGEEVAELAQWWTTLQEVDHDTQKLMVHERPKTKRRRRRKKK
jgi:poly(A) polymerase